MKHLRMEIADKCTEKIQVVSMQNFAGVLIVKILLVTLYFNAVN